MAFDATFWVAVSFVIFFGALIYLKVPQNVNNLLSKMITDIKMKLTKVKNSELNLKDYWMRRKRS